MLGKHYQERVTLSVSRMDTHANGAGVFILCIYGYDHSKKYRHCLFIKARVTDFVASC